VQRAYALVEQVNPSHRPVVDDEESRRILFGQGKEVVSP